MSGMYSLDCEKKLYLRMLISCLFLQRYVCPSMVFFLEFIVQSTPHLSHFTDDAKRLFCCNQEMRVSVGLMSSVNRLNWLPSWLICSWWIFAGLILVAHGERPSTNRCMMPILMSSTAQWRKYGRQN